MLHIPKSLVPQGFDIQQLLMRMNDEQTDRADSVIEALYSTDLRAVK